MRIAVNTRFLIKDKLEGIGWFTYEIVRRLAEQHPEHDFYFFFDRPYAEEFIFAPNVKAIVLPPPARHASLWYIWFEWMLPRALNHHKIDVFFSPDGFLSLRTRVKTLMVTHDIAHVHFPEQIPFHGRIFYNYFVPKYLNAADKVIAVSNFTKEDIIRHYNIPPDKIDVACNGCRETFRVLNQVEKKQVRQQYSDGKQYFFYLGAVHPRKNVGRLIAAFDRFKKLTGSDMKLLIAGRLAWQTGAVKQAFDRAQYQEDIVMLGYMDAAELPRLMGAAFALTYISLFEGFGVPLLEAMQCEIPIIGAEAASIPEVTGKAGLLVDPLNTEAIASAMRQLLEHEPLRNRLIAEGRKQVRKFSWDKAASVVYENLMQLSEKAD